MSDQSKMVVIASAPPPKKEPKKKIVKKKSNKKTQRQKKIAMNKKKVVACQKKETRRIRRKKVKTALGFDLNHPFSRSNVLAARTECYVISAILVFMVWFGKDVSSLTLLISFSWAGYRGIQALYIWMAKNEHIIDSKLKLRKLGLDSTLEDEESDSINNVDAMNDSGQDDIVT